MTHEEFLAAVREHVADALDTELAAAVRGVKLVYGAGRGRVRGVTLFNAWDATRGRVDFVEISAFGEESAVQLAGTLIHELGHVIAGHAAAHGKDWREVTEHLGLVQPRAMGQVYTVQSFSNAAFRTWLAGIALADGRPVLGGAASSNRPGVQPAVPPPPCTAGIGTRGGTSRGPGSTRWRKYQCACGIIAYNASDDFAAGCLRCGNAFARAAFVPRGTRRTVGP